MEKCGILCFYRARAHFQLESQKIIHNMNVCDSNTLQTLGTKLCYIHRTIEYELADEVPEELLIDVCVRHDDFEIKICKALKNFGIQFEPISMQDIGEIMPCPYHGPNESEDTEENFTPILQTTEKYLHELDKQPSEYSENVRAVSVIKTDGKELENETDANPVLEFETDSLDGSINGCRDEVSPNIVGEFEPNLILDFIKTKDDNKFAFVSEFEPAPRVEVVAAPCNLCTTDISSEPTKEETERCFGRKLESLGRNTCCDEQRVTVSALFFYTLFNFDGIQIKRDVCLYVGSRVYLLCSVLQSCSSVHLVERIPWWESHRGKSALYTLIDLC